MNDPIHRFQFASSAIFGLASSSGLLVASRLVGTSASFLFSLLLARTLTSAEVGSVMTVISYAFLASILATMNIESGAIRYVAEAKANDRGGAVEGFVFFGRALLLAISPLVVIGFLLGSEMIVGATTPQPVMVFLMALSIPIMGWLRFSNAYASALGFPLRGSIPRTGLQPIVLLCVYAGIVFLASQAGVVTAAASFLFAFTVTALVQFIALRPVLNVGQSAVAATKRDMSKWRDWISTGLYMAPILLLQENLQYTVIIAASITLGEHDIALFAISLRFVAIIRFAILSVNLAASPKIASAIARGAIEERDTALRHAAILKTVPALVLAGGVIVFAAPILSIFGKEYTEGAAALRWFTLIPLASALLGPNQMLLNVAGMRVSLLLSSFCAVAILFIAIPLAGSIYGVNGAAAATGIVYAIWEAALYSIARLKVGADASVLSIFSRRKNDKL